MQIFAACWPNSNNRPSMISSAVISSPRVSLLRSSVAKAAMPLYLAMARVKPTPTFKFNRDDAGTVVAVSRNDGFSAWPAGRKIVDLEQAVPVTQKRPMICIDTRAAMRSAQGFSPRYRWWQTDCFSIPIAYNPSPTPSFSVSPNRCAFGSSSMKPNT